MANHVGDTWQAMCHNAWQRPMHVGHMEKDIFGVWELFIQVESIKKEKEGKKKRGKERKEREEKKRERRRRKGERKKEKRKAVFRRSELVRPRSKVCIFDEGYATRGRFPLTPIHFTPRGRVGA